MKKENIELSVIVPACNGADYAENNLKLIEDAVKEITDSYEIIVVEDGSTDGTDEIIGKICSENRNIIHSHSDTRSGKGGALTRGFNMAKGDIALFIDIDLEISTKYLPTCMDALKEGYDIVIGSTRHPMSKTKSPLKREILSKIYNSLVRLILKSKVHGHQTGLKCFRGDVIKRILPLVREMGWFWDTEVLCIAQWAGYKVKELPVECSYGFGDTNINPVKDSYDHLFAIFKLKKREKEIKSRLDIR